MRTKTKPKAIDKVSTNPYEGRLGLVYARVSSKKQETEGSGLDSQEQRCVSRLLSIKVPHTRSFRDSFSGGGDFMNRPAMRELLAHIDANSHQRFIVIFDDLSRFARDVVFHFQLRTAFRQRDVMLLCLNYNFDESDEGEYVETILAGKAQLDRKQNRRQVIQKMKARMDSGYWAFARKRGYDMIKDPIHGKIAVPNRDGLKILAPALEAFANGKLIRQVDVARYLVERKFWIRRNPEEYKTQVKTLLTDPFYAGYIEYPKWDVERRLGQHKALISQSTFEAIQARLNKPHTSSRVRLDISPEFPLRGLINCSCGSSLTAAYSKSSKGKRHPYYWCRNKPCGLYGKSIRRDDIEAGFKKVLDQGKLKPEIAKVLSAIFDKVWNEEMNGLARNERVLIQDIDTLEDKVRKLTELAYKAQNARLRAAYEKQVEEVIQELDDKQGRIGSEIDLDVPYRTALRKATALVKNPYSVWKKLELLDQHELFFFIFDDKIVYSKNEGYRTSETPTAARLFEGFAAVESSYVDIAHKSLNPIKSYLSRFWLYYQSSPALQNALANA